MFKKQIYSDKSISLNKIKLKNNKASKSPCYLSSLLRTSLQSLSSRQSEFEFKRK